MYVNMNIFRGKVTIYVADSVELNSFGSNPLNMIKWIVASVTSEESSYL